MDKDDAEANELKHLRVKLKDVEKQLKFTALQLQIVNNTVDQQRLELQEKNLEI